jgi:hypothetical protein
MGDNSLSFISDKGNNSHSIKSDMGDNSISIISDMEDKSIGKDLWWTDVELYINIWLQFVP